MKKAFFAYQYGMANAGDFAINIGSLDILSDLYEEITVVSKLTNNSEYIENKEYMNKLYNNINIIEGPFNLNRSSKKSTLQNYFSGILKYFYLVNRGKYKEAILSSNIVYLNGGNLLRCESLTDYIRLYALTFPLKIAAKNNKKFIFLPQSTTKVNKIGQNLLAPYINNADLTCAREEISYEKLSKNFPEANIINSLDTAFFIKDRIYIQEEFSIKYGEYLKNYAKNLTVTLRKEDIGDIGELSKEKKNKINNSIETLVKSAVQKGYHVTFIVQTFKDKEFTYDIYNNFKSNTFVHFIEEYNPLILREIYRNSACLFGMRLHSMILAMSVGTPVIGYFDHNWGSKNPGTLGQYSMPYTFIEEDAALFSLMNEALRNKEYMINKLEESKKSLISSLEEII